MRKTGFRIALALAVTAILSITLWFAAPRDTSNMSTRSVFGYGNSGPGVGSIDLSNITSNDGTTNQSTFCSSFDTHASVTIDTGTRCLSSAGTPLTGLTITYMVSPPNPPSDANTLGAAYFFDPSGATFSPAATISLDYSLPLPSGAVESNLYIAWFNTATASWVKLDTIVDQVNKKLTAETTHFSAFEAFSPKTPVSTPTTTNPVPSTSTSTTTTKPVPSTTATTTATTVSVLATPTSTVATTTTPNETETPSSGIKIWMIILIAGVLVAVLLVTLLIRIRARRNRL
jgi:hypothetical protein